MNKIGENLKRLITNARMSENELSKKIGIPQQMINRIISGANQNPKLSTITPIATYFKIPLQELVGGENLTMADKVAIDTTQKIPFIDFYVLEHSGIDKAIELANKYISIDVDSNDNYFATTMYDQSMEPKFSPGTILVFEKNNKVRNSDFCLLKDENENYIFRQVLINSVNKVFLKCLNPASPEYNIMPLPINIYVLARLLEARTSFFNF